MNLNRKNIFCLVALLFTVYATPSMAGFEIMDDAVNTAAPVAAPISSGEKSIFEATPTEVVNVTRVVHVGVVSPVGVTGLVSAGQGDISSALRTLTPKDWHGVKRGTPNLTKIVKWSGNQSWYEAINEALGQSNLMVELDWTQKKESIFSLPEKMKVAQVAHASPAKTAEVVNVVKSPAKVIKVEPIVEVAKKPVVAAPVVVQTWDIKSGETLRTALNRWMVALNWQPVVWEVQTDFELKAAATFTGNIDDALRKVADSAGVNILMYKGNHVCVVREGSN